MYRFVLMIALMVPMAATADGTDVPPLIDVVRFAAEASDQDVNGDGVADRLLLVVNTAGDAVDLLVLLSDPQTGAFAPAEVYPAVLPARWPKPADAMYLVNFVGGSDDAQARKPVIWLSGGGSNFELVLGRSAVGWQIERVQSRFADGAPSCVMNYVTGRAGLSRVRQDMRDIDIGPTPSLQPYWWRDGLPEVCLK